MTTYMITTGEGGELATAQTYEAARREAQAQADERGETVYVAGPGLHTAGAVKGSDEDIGEAVEPSVELAVGDLVYVTNSDDRDVLMRVTEIDDTGVYGCLASETDDRFCAPAPQVRQWLGRGSDATRDGTKIRMP